MNVLIAPDKFKGSLTAAEVVHHLGSGLEQRGIHYDGLPLADGGDGSVAAAVAAGFRSVEVDVAAATGERHPAAIAFDGITAVVEVANTCGLHTLPAGTLAPLRPPQPGWATPSVPRCSSRRSGSSWRSAGRPAPTAARACSPPSARCSGTRPGSR